MKSFFELASQQRAELIQSASFETGLSPIVLEKDIWVCWVLHQIFTMPNHLKMAFKGGTSLSKVFKAINRFSEDLDITIDFKDWGLAKNPLDPSTSNTQRKNLSDQIKSLVKAHVTEVVAPYLEKAFQQEFGTATKLEMSGDGEQVQLFYASVFQSKNTYIPNRVLIEFGGRNVTEPSEVHSINPYLAESVKDIKFPTAQVNVLSPVRTFWEKATLIHVECHRESFKTSAERLSRHWYDLVMLLNSEIGKKALLGKEILSSVLEVKKVFFNSAYANYERCLTGGFRLVPPEPLLGALKSDYLQMVDAGMFYEEPLLAESGVLLTENGERIGMEVLKFEEIIRRLKELETLINEQ